MLWTPVTTPLVAAPAVLALLSVYDLPEVRRSYLLLSGRAYSCQSLTTQNLLDFISAKYCFLNCLKRLFVPHQ